MDFVYDKKIVSAFRRASNSYVPFYVVAQGELNGCTLYFGSCDKKKGVEEVIEGKTGVRCFNPPPFRAEVPTADRLQKLYEGTLEAMCKSPFGDIGVASYLCEVCDRRGIKRNFAELWKISLLIGF